MQLFMHYFMDSIGNLYNAVVREMFRNSTSINITIILSIALGLLFGMLGFKIFKLIIALGSTLVFGIVAWAAMRINNSPQEMANVITALSALGGAFAGYFLYKIGLFLQGFIMGGLLSILILANQKVDMNEMINIIIPIVSGVGTGIFFVVLSKFMTILYCAANGAFLIAAGIQGIIIQSSEGNYNLIMKLKGELSWLVGFEFIFLVGIPFTVFFIYWQYITETNVTNHNENKIKEINTV